MNIREVLGWTQDWANGSDVFKTWKRPDGNFVTVWNETVTVDDLLAWLREHGLGNIGVQDPDVGFPSYLPPGYWVEVQIATSRASYVAPTLLEALTNAVMAIAGVT